MRSSHIVTTGVLISGMMLAACTQQQPVQEPVERGNEETLGYNVLGQPDAPVTFVEYSDYQCPFCRKFTTESLPRLKSEYIDTGKVRYVFKDFPLEIHTEAVEAAVAAHCAGEQGEYFSYHDLLFEKAADREAAFTNENFTAWAGSLGLDTTAFSSCLESQAQRVKVEQSVAEAKDYGVKGTPSFLINGRLLSGAQPFAAFAQIIEGSADALPEVQNALCSTNADCSPARAFPPYCSRSDPNEVCTTTGAPTCKLPGTAESECVTIITEECAPCPDDQRCVDGQCVP